MKICRFGEDRIGLVEGSVVRDITPAFSDVWAARYPFPRHDVIIAALCGRIDRINEIAHAATPLPLDRVTLKAPIANSGKFVAAPVNYKRHLEEVRDQADLNHGNAAHMREIRDIGLFLKATSSLVGPAGPVVIGQPDRRNDHEIELAVIIGKTCTNVSQASALEHVAGYTIGLDMTVRGPEDRSFRKSLDSYSVLGPWLVTADEIPDPGSLGFELTVNGQTRQKANTQDLVMNVPELIAYASSFYTLYPGDVIFTGTPEGVGEVKAGDVMLARMDRIGQITVRVA